METELEEKNKKEEIKEKLGRQEKMGRFCHLQPIIVSK